ncbi:alpha/beta hydrolase [Rhodococcus sp. T2V]|uniref:alpha/beta fold hydrolase n=1 Tax=Rhodococcus sp. T2V TaxID=3034164 RepID=UPI0023E30CEE|nr:alpha/beta hydrolase [Rhodococcus sp. T2V]MDF3310564.1 alpha/beta hydrolase [Rhodococcus sp. T2V]
MNPAPTVTLLDRLLTTTRDVRVKSGDDVEIVTHIAGSGPLVVLVHGFPDTWISWRHQIEELATSGYRVAALETRGYGASSCPHPIEAYTVLEMSADIIAVMDALGEDRAVLVGHDWGADQTHATALVHPDRVEGLITFTMPALEYSDVPPSQIFKTAFGDNFFYWNYFLEEDAAENALDVDPAQSIRKFLYGMCGERGEGVNSLVQPPGTTQLLPGLPDPEHFPNWLAEDELEYYRMSFVQSGFRGAVNRYRAADLDVVQMRPWADCTIDQPVLWIGGALDPSLAMVRASLSASTGDDATFDPVPRCTDVRGRNVLEGVGHWVQHEAPIASNRLINEFLAEISYGPSR